MTTKLPNDEINKPEFSSSEAPVLALENADNQLTEDETKQVLTPFAFKIDESLFGMPLAVPWRRGLALFVDFMLILILSETPGELLALVVAITFFRLGSKKRAKILGKTRSFKRALLRFIGAFIIFVVLVDTLPTLLNGEFFEDSTAVENKNDNSTSGSLNLVEGIALGAVSAGAYQSINASECIELKCWQEQLLPIVESLVEFNLGNKKAEKLIEGLVAGVDEKADLSRDDNNILEEQLFSHYKKTYAEQLTPEKAVADATILVDKAAKSEDTVTLNDNTKSNNQDSGFYKGVDWLQGIINDLGLSFGWAAFYFTVLTAAWHGQTPGKRLFNIRVIQLDGTPLSVWDSFGRYGGYGAGLATGLLGFLQIYWDPNRQAIHDKISATIVIDVKRLEQMQLHNNDN